jgi:hypothetical protein
MLRMRVRGGAAEGEEREDVAVEQRRQLPVLQHKLSALHAHTSTSTSTSTSTPTTSSASASALRFNALPWPYGGTCITARLRHD